MALRRLSAGMLLAAVAAWALVGCEPYMSMTDQIPAQTRQATALLPASPRYAGMVDLETVLKQIDEFRDATLVDSLRQSDHPRLRTFLEATGLSPKTDLKAVYGAVGGGTRFSAVLFADLTPAQVDRYLQQAGQGAGRRTTYRDLPVYHLFLGEATAHAHSPDTLSLAFVGNGMIAASMDAEAVRAMIDRHQLQKGGFRGNESYMALVERVGHGSTAWLVGRDVLQTALRDSLENGKGPPPGVTSAQSLTSEAGIQQLLSGWADRVLGMSDSPPSFEGPSRGKMKELQRRIREQALSLTLTDETLTGEAYLTMRDETSASHVVDVSKGAIAALRLSDQKPEGLKADLLEGLTVERTGPVVHVQVSVGRKHLPQFPDRNRHGPTARFSRPSTRRAKVPARRLAGISPARPPVRNPRRGMRPCNLCDDRPVRSVAGGADEGPAAP